MSEYFTSEEVAEIESMAEALRGGKADGKDIIGPQLLQELVSNKRYLNSISREDLLAGYAQIKSTYEFWNQAEWINTDTLQSILEKFRNIINIELETRRR